MKLNMIESFAVLTATDVLNAGRSVISGDVGSVKWMVFGFPPGIVTDGTIQERGFPMTQAHDSLSQAYLDAAGRTPDASVGPQLGGLTLTPGVYRSSGDNLELTGTLTLDAQGDPAAVFILQTADNILSTSPGNTVALVNEANPCNVFWQTGREAVLGTASEFAGTILAMRRIWLGPGARVQGRLLSLHDDVILNNNMINRPGCYTPPPNTKGHDKDHDKSHNSRELAAMAEDTERYAAVAG
ncbi:ice-binding family protein [Pseudonocardia sp.]|uniref:ice-binding family protein n=1 Tax=Pseudonocardia sp. TaxID=60912 RepID=UPI0031FBE2DF